MIELIHSASKRIKGIVSRTPIIFSGLFSRTYGMECAFKLENLQKTGSFKVRGAYNKISSLTNKERSRGVITASLGNHAQGVAWASGLLGAGATVVMPKTTPIIKYMATRGYGAEVIFHGDFFDEAYDHAVKLADERGLTFVHPFDDDLVIAGQGTIGLEILEEVPDVKTIVVPVGGGGLISGIASAVKETGKGVKVIGVEADASKSCLESLKAGRPVDVERRPTIADGIAVKRVGEKTFSIIKRYVDDVVPVSERTIAAAILTLLERKKIITEGAGAAPLAAAMEGKLPKAAGKTVFVLSGGNIDVTILDRVIRLGLLHEGRVVKVSVVLRDIPGSLAEFTAAIAELKANILHVLHQREAEDVQVGNIRIEAILEVEGREHAGKVLDGLKEKGYAI